MLGIVALEGMKAVFEHFGPAAADVDKLTDALKDYAATGKMAGELTNTFGNNMDDFKGKAGLASDATNGFVKGINNLLNTIGSGAVADWMAGITGTDTFNTATSDMNAYDDALASVMESSQSATKASELWRDALERSGLDTEQLAKILPSAWAEVGKLNSAAMSGSSTITGMSGAEQSLAKESANTTEKMQEQQKAADDLEKSVEDLFKQYQTADQAQIALRNSVISTNKEFKSGAKTLSLNTTEGRKNRTAVLDRLSAIEQAREAEVKSTGQVDKANDKYRSQINTLKATLKQMGFNRAEIGKLIDKYKDIPPKVTTRVTMTGDKPVGQKLALLSQIQNALKKGTQLPAPARRMLAFDTGGYTGPGDTHDVAGIVHADEHVIRKKSRRKIERDHPGLLDYANTHGELPPGYAGGGRVWPFPVTAAMTRIPSAKEVASAVTPDVPTGGRTDQFIVRVVRAAFPYMQPISTFRPGARTLSGNRSYHSMGRAVDWPVSHPLAEWWNAHYKAQTKEFISPWNDLNIHNGQRHTYTGAIYRQHNFAGGNAHDHIAMKNGGTIREPVIGVGASGRTYSFGENYQPEKVIPNWSPEGGGGGSGGGGTTTVYLTAELAAGANVREAGRQIAEQLGSFLYAGGTVNIRGKQVLP
jgi:hypothetical protein